jgi:hypothetical protein
MLTPVNTECASFEIRLPRGATGAGQLEAARASMTERPPSEAEIHLDALRGVRTLVVRGDWSTAPPVATFWAGA